MEKYLGKEKAITLIALIITIVVMLILAGVTINLTLGENGIFTTAQQAGAKNEKAIIDEEMKLAMMEIFTEEALKGENVTLEGLANGQLANKLEGITSTLADNKITGEYKGYSYEVDSNFNITILDKLAGIAFSYTLSPEGYTNGNVTLALNVSSTQGTITNIQRPSNLTQNENGTYTITQNGNYEFNITDSAGNTKTETVKVQKIDTEKPIDFTPTVNEESITETGFTITAQTQDAEATETSVQSGIARYEYYVNGTKYDTNVITGLEIGTEYTVYVIAYDNAKNSKKSAEITAKTKGTKSTYLYKLGNEYEDVTGGWNSIYTGGSSSSNGSVTKYDDYIEITVPKLWAGYAIVTNNSINLENINKIFIDCKMYSSGETYEGNKYDEVTIGGCPSADISSGAEIYFSIARSRT